MPTKTSQAEPVLVSVYVERPKTRSSTATSTSSSSSNKDAHHHHHHHHHHHYHYAAKSIKHEWNLHKHVDDEDGIGYSRRAQLFHYSQSLRQSAKIPPQSSPLRAKLISSNHHQDSANNVAVQRKPKYSRRSTCLGNWRIFFPKFCRSLSSLEAKKDLKKKKHVHNTKNAMKAAKDHLQQQKKRGYMSKLLQPFGKKKVKYRG